MIQCQFSTPKADLHVHFEGTVTRELFTELAGSRQIDPRSPVVIGGREIAGVPSWPTGVRSIAEFVSLYVKTTELLASPECLLRAGRDYLERCKTDSIIGAELYFTPTTFAALGAPLAPLFEALTEVERQAASDFSIRVTWIFDIVRLFPQSTPAVLKAALDARRAGASVRAIGLAGPEREGDAAQFADAFAAARLEGFDTIAHAGEGTSAANVLDTIRLLKPSRIGHALSVVDSEEACELCRQQGIVLEASPWSNLLLGVSTAGAHPLKRMFDAGLDVVICSDDPGMFEKSLSDNFQLANELGCSDEQLRLAAERSCRIMTGLR